MTKRGMAAGAAALLDLVLPESCAGCDAPGQACCGSCLAAFGAPRPVAVDDSGASGGPTYALARHADVARTLVVAHKERGRRSLTRPLGSALAAAVPHLPGARPDAAGTWWLVPAPSRPSAARARGGSHVLALARAGAAVLSEAGLPAAVAPALRLAVGARDAVGLDRAQRTANLAGRLRVTAAGAPPPGVPVVLLDDVVTTGATLGACRTALRRAGIEPCAALTLTAA
ncbi:MULTISPECIES: ComF family protein [Prauserella salsuginis group]|uniref:ComF family protein n=2 Tax=Prauserella salsuginis group TaxID=2893672 RepID=A0ABW6G9Z8_9PSEU|nr:MULTISPECIES: ComF family protein [Prauserella salsuginis group]MBB3663911.1 putative amidophosphoribosyltransferase [Prauserella sediminis]